MECVLHRIPLRRCFSIHGKPKKSLGQHFLKDKNVLQKILQYSNIQDNDIVLEIGPGSGQLTKNLLKKPIKVIAVEKDHELIPVLQQEFQSFIQSGQLTLIEGDILSIPLPMFTRCIANIPYYISSSLIQRFILENCLSQEYYLLVQKEFCSKMCLDTTTNNHDSTFLTVFLQSFFSPSCLFDVSPSCFSPPPKVMSSVLHLSPLSHIEEQSHYQEKEVYRQFLLNLFSTKNKSLQQCLQRWYPQLILPPSSCSIDLKKKVYQVSSSEYCSLFSSIHMNLLYVYY